MEIEEYKCPCCDAELIGDADTIAIIVQQFRGGRSSRSGKY